MLNPSRYYMRCSPIHSGNLVLNAYLSTMPKGGYIYIMTNQAKTVLYTGVTSDLYSRVYQHKNGRGSVFTTKYNCQLLVYYEVFDSIEAAIRREKRIKKYPRQWKENLINEFNPAWNDLFDSVVGFH